MKILVTGSKGQLGSDITSLSKKLESEFVFIDIDELDLTDELAVRNYITEVNPQYIINCAAYTAVDDAEKEYEKAKLVNSEAPKYIRRAAEKIEAKFIHISTDYVFDGIGHIPYKESDRCLPASAYGRSKLEGEKSVLDYNKGIVIRTSWLYSTFGNNFVKTMIRLGKERDELNVIFDQIGTPTYSRDLAKACLDIISKTEKDAAAYKAGIFHFSNEGVCSWYDFAKEIMEIYNIECKVKPIESKDYPLPAPRPFYSVLNKQKIKKFYSIEIPHWKDSLKECIKTLKSSENE